MGVERTSARGDGSCASVNVLMVLYGVGVSVVVDGSRRCGSSMSRSGVIHWGSVLGLGSGCMQRNLICIGPAAQVFLFYTWLSVRCMRIRAGAGWETGKCDSG